jgi:hypothetical protein
MPDIYCAKKKKFIPQDEVDAEYCEDKCSMFDTCQADLSATEEEAYDPDFEFSEEEDWDDDSDINNHEDDD